jgi:hypothetical protein
MNREAHFRMRRLLRQGKCPAHCLMERFGIAAEIKPKTTLLPPGPRVLEAVAKGDAEIGFG